MHSKHAFANGKRKLSEFVVIFLIFFKTIVEVLKLKYKRTKQVFKKGFNRQTAVRFMPHHARALLFWNSFSTRSVLFVGILMNHLQLTMSNKRVLLAYSGGLGNYFEMKNPFLLILS